MAPHSVITESDDASVTLTHPFANSPRSSSPRTTVTSLSDIPLLGHLPSPAHSSTSTARTPSTSDVAVPGWPGLANLIAETPEFESFSRFRELNVKTLLYYQVELAYLEKELKLLENVDSSKRGQPEGDYAKWAENLIQCKEEPSTPRNHKQWKVVDKIRKVLKAYNEALLQHAKISRLSDPDGGNVESLRTWLKRSPCGNYCISGAGSTAWGDPCDSEEDILLSKRFLLFLRSMFWTPTRNEPTRKLDLVTTCPPQKADGFTRWIVNEWIPLYHACRNFRTKTNHDDQEKHSDPQLPSKMEEAQGRRTSGSQSLETFEQYSEKTILRFTSSVATVVACILPTVAIGVLTTAKGNTQKLLYIGGFTALFAIGLMFFTDGNTTRVQIFTATAAFSAVLVVFVQNQ